MTVRLTTLFVGIALVLAPEARAADNALKPGNIELYPTYSAVGIEIPYTGDDNHNATTSFVWREQGEKNWRNGVDMTVDPKRHFIWASIWPLEQGKTIEIEVTFKDADAASIEPLKANTTTRTMILEPAGGKKVYVSPSGDDANPGTKEKPFKTLAFAAKQAKAGDIVYAMTGLYPEANLFGKLKGTADKPIVFTAAEGEKPVIDSSFEIKKNSGSWQESGGIYVANNEIASGFPNYLDEDGTRLVFYHSLNELKQDKLKAKRAWFYDAGTKKIHLKTTSDPNTHAYHLSRDEYGVYLDGSQYVVVKGFDICHCSNSAIRISGGARGCVIVDNVLHNVPGGIFMKNDNTQDNAIWRNEIYEPGLADLSWEAVKASDYPRQGIFFIAGRGTSVCHNRIHGWFDCICPETWKHPNDLILNRDCDVMFNDLYNAGDDAIEADGGGVNMRIHGNHIRNCWTALSLAPIERGPVYVTRNDCTFKALLFKFNVGGCTSLGWTYCYHNAGYCLMTGNDGGTMISFPPPGYIPLENKVLKNNAMIGNEWSVRQGKTGFILDGNCYYHVPNKSPRSFQWDKKKYATIDAFRQATGQETHGIYADPEFEDTPNLGKFDSNDHEVNIPGKNPLVKDVKSGDFRLKSSSPCIDKGVVLRGINDDFQGKAPDIGVFEFKSK